MYWLTHAPIPVYDPAKLFELPAQDGVVLFGSVRNGVNHRPRPGHDQPGQRGELPSPGAARAVLDIRWHDFEEYRRSLTRKRARQTVRNERLAFKPLRPGLSWRPFAEVIGR